MDEDGGAAKSKLHCYGSRLQERREAQAANLQSLPESVNRAHLIRPCSGWDVGCRMAGALSTALLGPAAGLTSPTAVVQIHKG